MLKVQLGHFGLLMLLNVVLISVSYASQSLKLNIKRSHYLTTSSISEHTDEYSYITLDYSNNGKLLGLPGVVDAQMTFGVLNSDELYPSLPQAYLSKKITFKSNVHIGRMLSLWSHFDDHWNLGLWQPQLKWDMLNPQAQGLTGVFWNTRIKQWQVQLFATPFFIPDQGASFDIEDGRLASKNRWFRPPVSQVELRYEAANINYQIKKPEVTDVLLNWGYGIRLMNGKDRNGFKLLTSYAYKPMNQFHLGIKAKQNISSGDVNPIIYPAVAYHHLASTELRYNKDEITTWISFTSEVPRSPSLPSEWDQSSLRPNYLLGVYLKHPLLWDYKSDVSWAYLKNGSFDTIKNNSNVVDGNLESSLERFPYENVLSVSWQRPWFSKYYTRLKYYHSFADGGNLLSMRFNYNFTPKSIWYLNIDMIGVDEKAVGNKNSFLVNYRGNDRIEGGLQYVF